MPKDAAQAALKELGHDFIARPESQRATPSNTEKQRKAEVALKGAIVRKAIGEFVAKATVTKPAEEFWKLLAFAMLQGSWHEVIGALVRRREFQQKGEPPEGTLRKLLPTLPENELRGVVVEPVVGRGTSWQQATNYGETFTRACKLFGVDLKKVEAGVKRPQAISGKAA